jgi:hypothetical protein
VEKTIFLYSHYIAVARNPGCKIEDGEEVVLDLIQCSEENVSGLSGRTVLRCPRLNSKKESNNEGY